MQIYEVQMGDTLYGISKQFGVTVEELNLENDLNSEKSVFVFYKELLKLRKENTALRRGDFKVISKPEDNYFAYTRTYKDENFMIVCNFESNTTTNHNLFIGDKVLSNYKDENKNSDDFRPYEIAVYKQNNK